MDDDELFDKNEDKFQLTFNFNIDGKESKIELVSADLKTLNEKVYLNDNIMNFYLRFIEKELVPESVRNKTYFYTTYFYSLLENKYTSLGYNLENKSMYANFSKNYEKVKKVINLLYNNNTYFKHIKHNTYNKIIDY